MIDPKDRGHGRLALFRDGSLAALGWALVSALLAFPLFGRPWQLDLLLGAGCLFYALLAWLLWLREDGFARRPPAPSGGAGGAGEARGRGRTRLCLTIGAAWLLALSLAAYAAWGGRPG